jgi:hypothetical protein
MRGSSRWNIEMIMGFILNHKGGEFKGTCASQGNVCEVCGKKGECDK